MNLHKKDRFANVFYVAGAIGWGTTDWSQLTISTINPDDYATISLSAPISAHDRGFVYGLTAGYSISQHFAWEFNYMRFSNTRVLFDEWCLYRFYNNVTQLNSHTYVYNVIGKFSVQILNTDWYGFSNAGAGIIHRHDALTNVGHISPTFGVGLGYAFKSKLLLEFVFQYYAGYGKAVLTPAMNYIPFLYTLHFKIGYYF